MENVIISDGSEIFYVWGMNFPFQACAIVKNHTTVKHHQFNLMDAEYCLI